MVIKDAAQTLQAREGNVIPVSRGFEHRTGTEHKNVGGLLEVAMQIAEERRNLMQLMRTALLNRNDAKALDYARQLCGVEA